MITFTFALYKQILTLHVMGFISKHSECKWWIYSISYTVSSVHKHMWHWTNVPVPVVDLVFPTISEMQIAIRDLSALFDFGVDLDYRYSLQMNQSKTYDDIRRDIKAEVADRLSFINFIRSWSNVLLLWTLGFVLVKYVVLPLNPLTI